MQRTQCRSHELFKPAPFGTEVCAHHIVATGTESHGLNGEQFGVVMYDRGSGWLGGYPTFTKTAAETQEGFQDFCGNESIMRFYSDCSPELIKAARDSGFAHDAATPG